MRATKDIKDLIKSRVEGYCQRRLEVLQFKYKEIQKRSYTPEPEELKVPIRKFLQKVKRSEQNTSFVDKTTWDTKFRDVEESVELIYSALKVGLPRVTSSEEINVYQDIKGLTLLRDHFIENIFLKLPFVKCEKELNALLDDARNALQK